MHVLIAHGSKRGGTAGLAAMIGDAFAGVGWEVDVRRAADVRDVSGFDVVIVAGALYMNRWHRDARRFVRRHRESLGGLPVWLVASGPLDDSAAGLDLPAVKQVEKLAARIGARGCVTFGGRLRPDARGFPASAMARTRSGDWRDPAVVGKWVAAVAKEAIAGASN